MNELISVVVPVYNVRQYIGKCIDSIINQTYKNLEIILVDDGSTDGSGELCDELKKLDSRNYGVARAKGMYIGFVDSDDYVDLEMYQKLYEVIKRENADVVECNLKVVYPDRIELFTNKKYYKICNKEEYLEEYLKIENIFGSTCVRLIKASIAKKIKFPIGKLYEDTFYSYDLIDNVDKVVILDNPYYNYLMREIVEKFHENTCENYPSLKKAADCRKMYAYFSVLNSILEEENFKNNYFYKNIINYFEEEFLELLKNEYITWKRKLSIILIKVNINLYRKILIKYKNAFMRN